VKCWRSPLLLALLPCFLITAISVVASEDPPRKSSLSDLEEEVLPFRPRSPRSDAELDRLKATALFAHGRMLYQRKEFPEALRRYQRAWQHDSTIRFIPAEVVKLALNLKRDDVAVRYAILAQEFPPSEISSFPRIASLLTNNGQFSAAARLYRQMIALRRDALSGSALLAIHLELGRLEYLADNYEASSIAFQYVVDALDDPVRHRLSENDIRRVVSKPEVVNNLIAESFLHSGRLDEAEAVFDAQQKQKPNDALHAYHRAMLAGKQGDLETAQAKLTEYFKSSSMDAGTGSYELLRELLQYEFKNPDRVKRLYIRQLEELHKLDPDNRELLSTLAKELIEAEHWQRARVCCEQMLSTRKSALLYRQMLQAFHGLWESGEDDQQTVDIIVRLLAKLAGSSGDVSSPVMEEMSQDITLVDRMLSLVTPMLENPEHFEERPAEQEGRSLAGRIVATRLEVAIAVGSLAIANQQAEKARSFFEFAIAQQPAQQARYLETWALRLLIADELELAIEVLEKAVGDDQVGPKQGFYFFLASAAEMAGDTDRALEAASQAAQLSPDNARIQSRLGWVYYHAGQYPEAEQQYLALIKKFDNKFDSAPTREVVRESRMLLSSICVRQKRIPEAEEWLEQVLDEFPEDVGAYNDLGYLWVDQDKRLERAQRMIKIAVDAEPDNGAYRDSLGWAYYRQGQFEEAIEQLLLAAENSEQDGVIFDHLGDAYFANEQAGKARESWKKALKLFGTDEEEMRSSVLEKLGKQPTTLNKSP
jgi:tetratricopeptide (TPR) repeat protein